MVIIQGHLLLWQSWPERRDVEKIMQALITLSGGDGIG